MTRAAAILALLAAAGTAAADVAPPDPPAGKKFVPVVYTVEGDQHPPGWVLLLVWWDPEPRRRGGPLTPKEQEAERTRFPQTRRLTLAPGERHEIGGILHAVPATAAAGYDSDARLGKDADAGKIPGAFPMRPKHYQTTLPASDPRTRVTVRERIDGIDPERGFLTTQLESEVELEDPDAPVRWPLWVAAGLAAAAGCFLVGLWLARRHRTSSAKRG